MPPAASDHGLYVEIHLFRLPVEEDRVIEVTGGRNHIRFEGFEFHHQRSEVGYGFAVTLDRQDLDAVLFEAFFRRPADRCPEKRVFKHDDGLQVFGRDLELRRQNLFDEIGLGVPELARGGAVAEDVFQPPLGDGIGDGPGFE